MRAGSSGRWIVGLVTAVTLVGYGAAVASGGRWAPLPVRVTQDSGRMPPGCGPRSVARLLDRVFVAFNGADGVALSKLVAPASRGRLSRGERVFDRFAVQVAPSFGTFARSSLVPSLQARFRRHDRFRLLAVAVSRSGRSIVGFAFLARRRADDIRRTQIVSGKGGVDCTSNRLYNLFGETRATTAWPAGRPALACTGPADLDSLCPLKTS